MKTEKDFEDYLNTIKKIAAEEGFDTLDETYVRHLKARFLGEDVIIGQGARVSLRELKLSDLELFYAFEDAASEPVLKSFIKDSKEESEEYLQAYISHMYPMYDYGIWAVELKESGEVIGLCGLGQTPVFTQSCPELGYYIAPKWRKCGFASECVEIVLDYVKNYLEFPVIYAIIKEDNTISKGLLRKFGFRRIRSSDESDKNHLFCK